MLIQALLIGLWAGIAGIDLFDIQLHIHRPVEKKLKNYWAMIHSFLCSKV